MIILYNIYLTGNENKNKGFKRQRELTKESVRFGSFFSWTGK